MSDVPVFLITIEHPTLSTPMRISSDNTERFSVDPLMYGTTSRGEEYYFLPISVTPPDEGDDRAPAIRIQMDNVARTLVPLLRSVSTPPVFTIEMVFASDPDTVEASWPEFDLSNAEYNSETVMLDLVIDAMQNEPYPAGRFNPEGFGGLF